MKKTALPLGLALALSVTLNVVLLRREPTAAPAPRPATASAGSPRPAPVEIDGDKILLREEVRLLRNQLAVAKTRLELERNVLGFPTNEPVEQPETRDYQALMELVQSFIEERSAEARDEQGRSVTVLKAVLTPQNLDAALRAIEDYGGLDGAASLSFHEGALSAIDGYRRIADTYNREMFAAAKAGENDEFFEDDARRKTAVSDRLNRNHDEWVRTQVQQLRDSLDRRDGVRAALLSLNLSSLLAQLGSTDDQ